MDWFCHSLLDKADQNLPHELEVLQFTAARKKYYPWYLVDRIQKLLNLHFVFVFYFAFTSNHVAVAVAVELLEHLQGWICISFIYFMSQ